MKNYLKWETWIYGLGAAVIGGGSGAVVSAITASVIAPNSFNLSSELGNFFKLAVANFVASGALAMFYYLKQSPLPQLGGDTTVTVKTPSPTEVKISTPGDIKPPVP